MRRRLNGLLLAAGMMVAPLNHQVLVTGHEATIIFKDNLETLTLSNRFETDAAQIGWIIPVPSRPQVKNSSHETTVFSPAEGDEFLTWFQKNRFPYPIEQAQIINDYLKNHWYLVAAKTNADNPSPLTVSFQTEKIIYPLKIAFITGNYQIGKLIFREGFNGLFSGWATQGGKIKIDENDVFEDRSSLAIMAEQPLEHIVELTYLQDDLVPNQAYTLSAYLKAGDNTTGTAYLEAGMVGLGRQSLPITLTDQWQRLSLVFTPITPLQQFRIVAEGMTAGETFRVDAVQLETGFGASDYFENSPLATQNQVEIQFSVFTAKDPVELPGFKVDSSGWDNTHGKMYLTKLSRTMTPSEMTQDLQFEYAQKPKYPITIPLMPILMLVPFLLSLLTFWLVKKIKRSRASSRLKSNSK